MTEPSDFVADLLYKHFNRRFIYGVGFVIGLLFAFAGIRAFRLTRFLVPSALVVFGMAGAALFAHLWRIEPLQFRQRLARSRARPSAKSSKEGRTPFAIAFDDAAWSVTSTASSPKGPPISVPWASVCRIAVLKRDLLTVDLICMVLETREGQTVTLDEEMVGFQVFAEAIPRHIPGALEWQVWWPEVAFPAFATNVTYVFGQPDGAA